MSHDPWKLLDLPRDAPLRDIKRRYAELLKLNRPDDDPDRFALLRHAYETCLAQSADTPAASPQTHRDAQPSAPPSPDDASTQAPVVVAWSAQSLGLDRLGTLRAPEAVVDELLVAASTPRDNGEAFIAWFTRCPEIASFAARAIVERYLLRRIADTIVTIDNDAYAVLEDAFGWSDVGFEQRLLAQGVHPHEVRRIVTALEPMAIDVQFARHLASGATLCAPSDGASNTLGNPDAEAALLRRLHDERHEVPRLLRAFGSRTVGNVNALVRAYALCYGNAAADRLFGVDAMNFWKKLAAGAPPGMPLFVLDAVRVFASTLALLLLMTMFGLVLPRGAESPPEALKTWWIIGLSCAVALVFAGTVLRWLRSDVLPRWRAHRARTKDDMEALVRLPHAAIPLLFLLPLILWSTTQFAGILVTAIAAIVAVAYFFGAIAAGGAAVFAFGVAGGIAFGANEAKHVITYVVAAVPSATWLFDRIVFRWTAHPTLDARGPVTAGVLAALGTAALFAGVLLA